MSFADEVTKAVTDAETAAPTNPYRAVLEDLAKGLRQLEIGADITTGKDPRRLRFTIAPRHRPARSSLMLSFFIDGDALLVFGESQRRMNTPTALEEYLLEFVKLPAFLESIKILREQADEPVEARLRASEDLPFMRTDVLVEVKPEDQKRIAEATPGSEMKLDVARIEFPGNATFADPAAYKVLDSAGYRVAIGSATTNGEVLSIRGTRA